MARIFRIPLCFFIYLLVWSSLPAQDDLFHGIIMPEADVAVQADSPNTNFNGEALMVASDSSNQPTAESFLRFSLRELPPGAEIQACTLQLVIANNPGIQGSRLFAVNKTVDWNPDSITWDTRPQGSQVADTSLAAKFIQESDSASVSIQYVIGDQEILNGFLDSQGRISMKLSSESFNSELAFYSRMTADANSSLPLAASHLHRVARLLVRYSLPISPLPPMSWPQAQFGPQHQGRIPWSVSSPPETIAIDTFFSSGYIALTSALGRHHHFVFTYENSGQFIHVLNSQGEPEQSLQIQDSLRFPMVFDRELLYVVAEDSLTSYVMDETDTLSRGPEKAGGDIIQSLMAPISLDAVSNRYYVTRDYVLAATPSQVDSSTAEPYLWVFPFPNAGSGLSQVSPVCLSEDESMAYVIGQDTLYAIDKQQGKLAWKLDLPAAFSGQLPVALAEDSLAIAVTGNEGYFGVVKGGEWIWKVSASEISQPVYGASGHLYAVVDSVLTAYAVKSGTVVHSTESGLAPSSPLVMDQSGNLFFISDNQLYGFDTDLTQLFAVPVSSTVYNNLLLSSDGSLYANDQRAIFRFRPSQLQPASISISDSMLQHVDKYVFRAGQCITLEGGALPTHRRYILQSGGGVGMQKGLSIPVGTQVIVQTGYK